jgi:transcription elongation factor Elf1
MQMWADTSDRIDMKSLLNPGCEHFGFDYWNAFVDTLQASEGTKQQQSGGQMQMWTDTSDRIGTKSLLNPGCEHLGFDYWNAFVDTIQASEGTKQQQQQQQQQQHEQQQQQQRRAGRHVDRQWGFELLPSKPAAEKLLNSI